MNMHTNPPPPLETAKNGADSGFTLIELSIALVIIGLIVGGVLVGRDLIKAAEVRATITQIEKYNSAANTFYGKYGYLPGDIPNPYATQFGFLARGTLEGQGDGNGLIEGYSPGGGGTPGLNTGEGETTMFWVDLSTARLIDDTFNTVFPNTYTIPADVTPATTPNLGAIFPQAKIGNGNYIYVYSINGQNRFGLSQIYDLQYEWELEGRVGISVAQAYAIDSKIDDGLPRSGRVNTSYVSFGFSNISTEATPDSTTTCSNSTTLLYSITVNNGAGINCNLSFKMQAGD
jgi:prepilin-type N-terminal cleavage/methylation domain-containing protein